MIRWRFDVNNYNYNYNYSYNYIYNNNNSNDISTELPMNGYKDTWTT